MSCICNQIINSKYKRQLIADGDWTALYMEYKDDKYKLSAYGEDVAELNINYCPICGKKLKGVK